MSGPVGRFAPSPSGRLHLGNLACSLLAWLSAKSQGGRIVLRIEDLDAARCPRVYADQLEEDLRWLGLVWDEGGSDGGPNGPYYQSECAPIYLESYHKLEEMGLVYPCFCSRAQLHAASAPHTSDGNVVYPGTCRNLTPAQIAEKSRTKAPAWRVKVPDEEVTFTDLCMGEHRENLLTGCGDFYLRRADGVFAYQLAVVVDDARMGITQVVRGADLLSSTARQIYLYRLLGLTPPAFAHCPLLLDVDGRRLSKRDGDQSAWKTSAAATPPPKSSASWPTSTACSPSRPPAPPRACWTVLTGPKCPNRTSAWSRACSDFLFSLRRPFGCQKGRRFFAPCSKKRVSALSFARRCGRMKAEHLAL